jgi:hypothetical protein
MKTDAYTKCVLTVIACCLLYIVAKDVSVIPNAHANAVMDVNIVKVAGGVIGSYEGVPVKLK